MKNIKDLGPETLRAAKPFRVALQAGFTLIELLVVVLIIGILSAVALPQYQAAVLKTRWSGLLVTARSLLTAQQAFFLANGYYADDLTQLDIEMLRGGVYDDFHGLPNSRVSYADGMVMMNTGSTMISGWGSAFLLSHNEKYPGISILISYSTASTECRAAIANAAATQACRSMGGVESGYCSVAHDCKRYVLN